MTESSDSSTHQLTTTDLHGRRLWVYPARVFGLYRNRRNWISGFLLVFFLAFPWVRVDGQQFLLLDIWNGKFCIFGLKFWSHDAPMLLFIVAGGILSLAFVTAIWGRVWCGWTCPQTVFVDHVFRRIENWLEGDSVLRRRLDQSPWSIDKFFKKSMKWSLFFLVALVISHSFLGYFMGTAELAKLIRHSPLDAPFGFLTMAALTGWILFDFGWLREQFCVLLCPYGRFQSVLMDDRSMSIQYDQPRGDCISCNRCVQVCPTGIDIRDGLQLECIACSACVDACDTVMEKIGKPKGLIRYQMGLSQQNWFKGRVLVLLIALLSLFSGLFWIVVHRQALEVNWVRAIGKPFQEVMRTGMDGEIVNQFRGDLLNQSFASIRVDIKKSDGDAASGQVVSADFPVTLEPGESKRVNLFVRVPSSSLPEGRGKRMITLIAPSGSGLHEYSQEVSLVGPIHPR